MMSTVDQARLQRIIGQQTGLFSRNQATECGYSDDQIRHRLAKSAWRPVIGTTYALPGLRLTTAVRDRAAQLSVPGSVLAAASAARAWDIPVPDSRSYLYVGPNGRCRLPGVVAIHVAPDPRDVSLVHGIPTTSASCAIVECLRRLPHPAALTLLDRCLQNSRLTPNELSQRIVAGFGRRGNPRLLRLLDEVIRGERAESERRLTTALRAAGVRGWRPNVEIHDAVGLIGIGDVVFEERRLVVELDGWAFHVTPDRFQRDRERQNRLVAAGWTVLRFTWRDLVDRPAFVVSSIRELLG